VSTAPTRIASLIASVVLLHAALPARGSGQARPLVEDLLRAQQERSWISPGRILKWTNHGFNLAPSNVDSLLFEAHIAPSFTAWGQELRDIPWLRWFRAFTVTPRIRVRMRTAGSEPVRSPSYNPFLSLYTSLPAGDSTDLLLLRFAHHSNGQEGDVFRPDGTLNLVDGSFSTNYVEVGPLFTVITPGRFTFVRPTVERHFGQDSLAQESYGQWRLNLRALTVARHGSILKGLYQNAHVILQSDVGWFIDRKWLPFEKRLDLSVTGAILSPFGGTMGPFVEAYIGRDYYNLRYRSEQIWIVRFGFTTAGGEYSIP
jgi:hypothetical protein